MKKIFLVTAFLVCSAAATFAATHRVTVSNFKFTPATINAAVGDVIIWRWQNGTHTTTSTSVPAGARTWNAQMNSTSTRFRYVIRVAGTYTYECTFHPAEMQGTITVTASPRRVESPTSR